MKSQCTFSDRYITHDSTIWLAKLTMFFFQQLPNQFVPLVECSSLVVLSASLHFRLKTICSPWRPLQWAIRITLACVTTIRNPRSERWRHQWLQSHVGDDIFVCKDKIRDRMAVMYNTVGYHKLFNIRDRMLVIRSTVGYELFNIRDQMVVI